MPKTELADINVLVYAFHRSSAHHEVARQWLSAALADEDEILLPDFVLAGFVRIATNRRAYATPASNETAFAFANGLRESAGTRFIAPGPSHWRIFEGLCRSLDIVGPGQSDAYLAAFAYEQGCALVSADRGLRKFGGLQLHLITDTVAQP